jgi:argininosuccinate synthase
MQSILNYKKTASHEAIKGEFNKCLLLYSGGLDTSVMLKWIQEEYDCEVIALTIDLGQKVDDLEAIKQKGLKLGATTVEIYDAKDEFADTLLAEAIKSNADYQGGYALSTPLGRVAISEIAVKVADKYGCQVIAHGCTGKGNDQVRFEGYITTLNPELKTIAPVREWGMGRQEEIAYAEKHNIPVKQLAEKPYSYDENMWGNTGEGGEIESPTLIPPLENILQWCNTIEKTPNDSETIKITFEQGVPAAINGKLAKLSNLIQECNDLGAKHGVGVFHLIEDRLVGLKVRGIYENPGATILIKAHKNIEQLVSTRAENELKATMDQKWAYMTYAASWYDPTLSHIRAYTNSQNKKVNGIVTVRLFKGNADVVAIESPYTLFDSELATFERNDSFNQNASPGFIEIHNLSQKTARKVMIQNEPSLN